VNLSVLKQLNPEAVAVDICLIRQNEAELQGESELDERALFLTKLIRDGYGTPLTMQLEKF
jgi:hypothetical protein